MNQREKGYWADLENLKQELASVASEKGVSPGYHNDSALGDDAHAPTHEEGYPSLPQEPSEGEKLALLMCCHSRGPLWM